jgi:hypothetical protein
MAKKAKSGDDTSAGAAPATRRVRATQVGYYDEKRRRVGDVFTLKQDKDFSQTWMEEVDPHTPEKITTGAEVLRQQHDEILAGKATGDANVLGND